MTYSRGETAIQVSKLLRRKLDITVTSFFFSFFFSPNMVMRLAASLMVLMLQTLTLHFATDVYGSRETGKETLLSCPMVK